MNCLDFPPVLPWRVMARLFKTPVNTPLLLPIYFVPVDFYRTMCGLIVSRRPPINSAILLRPPPPPPRRFQPRSSALRPGQEGALVRGIRH